MLKKSLIIVSVVAICCIFFVLIYQRNNNETISGSSAMYPNATMDMLIEDAQYIALVEVMDNGKRTDYEKDITKQDGTIQNVMCAGLDITLQVLESYKGIFDSNEIIYRINTEVAGNMISKSNTEHPNFVQGEKMILFMWKEQQNNTYYLYYGIQGAFKFDNTQNKYINSNNVEFKDIKEEIDNFNNKPIEERNILPKGDFFNNI